MVMRAAAAAVVLALAGGCGDDLVKAEWFHGSARLAVRAWATAGGYRYAFGWRDRMLDVTCDADAIACAPRVAAYFADASCRQLVVASHEPLPPIASFIDGAAGDGHGVLVEAAYTGPLYAGWRGCVLAGETDPRFHYATARGYQDVLRPALIERVGGLHYTYPDFAYVALASADAAAEAEGTAAIHVEDGPDRLRTRYLLDAGQPLAIGIDDSELDTPCAPAPDRDGALRCLPPLQVALYRDAFLDPACTQPAGAPVYRDRGFATAGDGYVRVDREVAGAVYVRAGALCLASGPRTALWQPGDPIEPAGFEPMFVEELGP